MAEGKGLVHIVKDLTEYPEEQEWFEFKENWYDHDGIGEYISSLSNAAALKGEPFGYLVWGVNDKTHKFTGTTFDFRKDVGNEPLEHYLARNVYPDVNFEFKEDSVGNNRIVVLIVPAADTIPTSFKEKRYLRVGSSKVNLMKFPKREAALFKVLNNGMPTMLNTVSDYQNLTFEQLFVYYGAKGVSINKRTFKRNLKLLTEDGKYNLLARLLSDNPHIPIRFSLFAGKTKTSTLYSSREFGNMCLLMSLDRILEYGEVLNVPQADERNRVVERKEVMLFDADAYREAVINAFVHNLWTEGNEPMFTMYEDRIEILSRGTFAPTQTLDGFFAGESVPVNEKLSEIFLQLGISEKSGRGVPVIVGAYGRKAYEFRENSIVVTIPLNRLNLGSRTEGIPPVVPPVNPSVDGAEDGADVEKKILKFCKQARNIREIMDYLEYKDKKTVRKYLSPLIQQGLIAMTIPDKPNSSKQKYIAIGQD